MADVRILKPLKFVWSWSALDGYRTCPKRHFEVKVQKNFKDTDYEGRSWGNAFHDAMAKRLTTKRMLPPEYQEFEKLAKWVEQRAQGGKLRVELQLGMDRNFDAIGYWDEGVWYRAKVDVLIIQGKHAFLLDWKTGKVKAETSEQLALNAQAVLANFPEVETVSTQYVWVGGEKTKTTDEHWSMRPSHYVGIGDQAYAVNCLGDMWGTLLPELRDMERAYAERDFPARPGGLCKAYCPVTSCIHNGRRP